MSGKYEDIIDLPHHTSDRHARMSMHDRAAQFSPFAALTGYDAAIKETSRLTESRVELTEEEKAILDAKLREVAETDATIRITYFLQDDRKDGGAYVCAEGQVKKLDSLNCTVRLRGGTIIPVADIFLVDEIDISKGNIDFFD